MAPADTSPAQDAAGAAVQPGRGLYASQQGSGGDDALVEDVEATLVDTTKDGDLVGQPNDTVDLSTPPAAPENDGELNTRQKDQMGTGSQLPSPTPTPTPAREFWLHLS